MLCVLTANESIAAGVQELVEAEQQLPTCCCWWVYFCAENTQSSWTTGWPFHNAFSCYTLASPPSLSPTPVKEASPCALYCAVGTQPRLAPGQRLCQLGLGSCWLSRWQEETCSTPLLPLSLEQPSLQVTSDAHLFLELLKLLQQTSTKLP